LGIELDARWTIADDKGNVHNVTFNMDIHNPMITEGRYDLRSFYDFNSHKFCDEFKFLPSFNI